MGRVHGFGARGDPIEHGAFCLEGAVSLQVLDVPIVPEAYRLIEGEGPVIVHLSGQFDACTAVLSGFCDKQLHHLAPQPLTMERIHQANAEQRDGSVEVPQEEIRINIEDAVYATRPDKETIENANNKS